MSTSVGDSATADSAELAAINELVLANRILSFHGVLNSFGHVSVRDPGGTDRFLLARSMAPSRVGPSDILRFNLAGEVIGTPAPPYLERFIHAEIYRARPDAGAVVHSHSASIIPFSVTAVPLRPVFHMSAFLSTGVPVYDIRETSGDTDLLIRNSKLGAELAATMGQSAVALQRGHGCVVVGSTLRSAVFRSIYLEINARLQMTSMTLGDVTYLTPGEGKLAAAAVETQVDRAWDEWSQGLAIARARNSNELS